MTPRSTRTTSEVPSSSDDLRESSSTAQFTLTPLHLKVSRAFGPRPRLSVGVLSLGKLAAGQQQYYLDAVARGVEDYYTGAGEAPGEWIGAASAELALAGHVEDVDLHSVLSGLDPRTLASLVRSQQRVPGFDLTFSAPKSVSLVWALSQDQEVAAAVVEAHDAAVRAAIGWLEAEGCFGRRGRQGPQRTKGSGFVAAAFRHRTSRAGDPQLHTHVLVANLVHGEDGRWSALDARHVYALAKTAGTLYRSELRDRLTRTLGVACFTLGWIAQEVDRASSRVPPRPRG
jgi:conjugative relaxase-like TrwC/TraI family protein